MKKIIKNINLLAESLASSEQFKNDKVKRIMIRKSAKDVIDSINSKLIESRIKAKRQAVQQVTESFDEKLQEILANIESLNKLKDAIKDCDGGDCKKEESKKFKSVVEADDDEEVEIVEESDDEEEVEIVEESDDEESEEITESDDEEEVEIVEESDDDEEVEIVEESDDDEEVEIVEESDDEETEEVETVDESDEDEDGEEITESDDDVEKKLDDYEKELAKGITERCKKIRKESKVRPTKKMKRGAKTVSESLISIWAKLANN